MSKGQHVNISSVSSWRASEHPLQTNTCLFSPDARVPLVLQTVSDRRKYRYATSGGGVCTCTGYPATSRVAPNSRYHTSQFTLPVHDMPFTYSPRRQRPGLPHLWGTASCCGVCDSLSSTRPVSERAIKASLRVKDDATPAASAMCSISPDPSVILGLPNRTRTIPGQVHRWSIDYSRSDHYLGL